MTESSASRFIERVERLDDPMNVKKGYEGGWLGDSHMPIGQGSVNTPRMQLTFCVISPAFSLPLP